MTTTDDQLVGRVADVALLDELIVALEEGRPKALSVVGGPGIGKTRLLAELTGRAEGRGHLVLSGSGSELERDLPFGVFVDAIDDYVESLDPQRLARLEDAVRTELARVFPAIRGSGSDAEQPLQDERYRSHRAVRTLLETLATKPLVLVLDDFHWADAASIELAGALVRRAPAARVMLVFAARPRRTHQVFAAALARAERHSGLVRHVLEPLSLDDARTLLGPSVAPAAAAVLHQDSGGVPFYLEQLARVARPPGRVAPPAPGESRTEGQVPPAVVAALREELAGLDDGTRNVLEGAAVAGDPFEPELAAAAADVTETVAVDALDELLRSDFVRPTDVPRRFRFRHPLVRRAVYEGSRPAWRLGAHERTALALEHRGASVPVRAHHVERSARQGDPAAAALLQEAGHQASARAPATAARWYAGALRLLSESAPPEERVALLLARADALAAVGRLADSHADLETSLSLSDGSTREVRARLTLACAAVERYQGHHQQSHRRLELAVAGVPAGSPESVALAIDLAIDGFYRVEFDVMQSWADRAVAEADALGDAPLRSAAHSMLTLAGAWTGDVARAEAALLPAVDLLDALSDADLARRLDAAVNLAAAELYLDRFPDAARHAERALRACRETGRGQMLPALYAILGTAWSIEGRLADAADLLDGALDAARLRDDDQGLAWVLFNRAQVAVRLGDVDGALDFAGESVERTRTVEKGLVSAWAGVWLGAALLANGEPERAAEAMVASAGGEGLELIPGGWRVLCLDSLTRAWLEAGHFQPARRAVGAAEEWAQHVRLPVAEAMAARARARLELATGDPARAADHALASIATLERVGARLEVAIGRALAGKALAAAGDRDAAVEQLTLAAEALGRFGAVRYRDATEQDLRGLGARVHRRARDVRSGEDGLRSLSSRELEVARLTVDRLTNREIAGRLFLSEKTIETHMRRLFQKLGVSSRVQVARAVEQADRLAARDT